MVRALAGDSTITKRVPSPPAWFAARLDPVRAVLAPVPFAVVPLVAPLRAGTLVPTSHPQPGPPQWRPAQPHIIRRYATLSLLFNPQSDPRCSPPRSAVRGLRCSPLAAAQPSTRSGHQSGANKGGQPDR